MTDDTERVSEVHAVKNFNLHFANSETTDSRHLENWKSAVSQDDVKRVSQVYRPSAILDFKKWTI